MQIVICICLLPALQAKYVRPKAEHGNSWQQQPGYCGSHYQLAMVGSPHMPHNSASVDVTVDVTKCLNKAGIRTHAQPAILRHPERGPATQSLSVKLTQFVWVATDRAGHDVSARFDFGAPKLTWSWLEGGDVTVGTVESA